MANKLKKSTTPKAVEEKPVKAEKAEKPVKADKSAKSVKGEKNAKSAGGKLKTDREEKVDLKKLARDERTWKIIGTCSLLMSIFLFIAFVSYLFTWKDDQSQVWGRGLGFLFDNDVKVHNLLGRLGAFAAHGFIRNGFGLASFLFCTFFFVAGINLLVDKKVFSIRRNLKYVTIGLMILSVSFAFALSSASFPFGGKVGDLISSWLVNFLGAIGTAALLLVVGASYLIWQFNPSFNWFEHKAVPEGPESPLTDAEAADNGHAMEARLFVEQAPTVHDMYAEKENEVVEKGNILKGEGGMVVNMNGEIEKDDGLSLFEKDEPEEMPYEEELIINQPIVEKEIVDDLMHQDIPA
ncbi:MAG TPA: DNA translocase FtsK 4TM domain-containing protein, partial [Flavisolibacter sp.]|nr:DNA translocase FtsK 4TM domain-containing protein [Flavisolibacter sp.]